jgi:hypothetical protein
LAWRASCSERLLDRIPSLWFLRSLRTQTVNRPIRWADGFAALADILVEVEALTAFAQNYVYPGMAAAITRDLEDVLDRLRVANDLEFFCSTISSKNESFVEFIRAA